MYDMSLMGGVKAEKEGGSYSRSADCYPQPRSALDYFIMANISVSVWVLQCLDLSAALVRS